MFDKSTTTNVFNFKRVHLRCDDMALLCPRFVRRVEWVWFVETGHLFQVLPAVGSFDVVDCVGRNWRFDFPIWLVFVFNSRDLHKSIISHVKQSIAWHIFQAVKMRRNSNLSIRRLFMLISQNAWYCVDSKVGIFTLKIFSHPQMHSNFNRFLSLCQGISQEKPNVTRKKLQTLLNEIDEIRKHFGAWYSEKPGKLCCFAQENFFNAILKFLFVIFLVTFGFSS